MILGTDIEIAVNLSDKGEADETTILLWERDDNYNVIIQGLWWWCYKHINDENIWRMSVVQC